MFEQQHIETKKAKVIITGAAGFIGGHVTEYFCKRYVDVSCYVRKSSDLSLIKNLPVNIINGSVKDYSALENAFKNMDSVIHIAGLVKDWGKYEDFYETNVKGTLNVLKACKANSIQNIIITGSISSYGEENSPEIKTEEHPYNSHYKYFLDSVFPCKMNYYRDTKSKATQEAIKFATENDINLTIIEPVWVYGENEFSSGFYEYIKSVKGMPFFLGSSKNKFHVVYVKDLARAYFLAFTKKLSGTNRIIIGDKKVDFMDRVYSLFCEELGVKKPKNLPKAIFYPIGFLMELFNTVFSLKNPPLLTRGRVNMFYDNIEYSTKNAEELLGFTNEFSIEEGIKKTVNWYKENNLI
ncbi:MAG: NAD-dependent epimerase/dehydratase family protein [Saprospiraceae bacterium]|nr:NAD-dependent epimerase/dehydratase family protein [Saprospiraceae bacterium]